MSKFVRNVNLIGKRSIDIIVSVAILVMLAPVFIITSILIKITMPGPVFFKQVRVGKNKRLFSILKFRTMKVDKEAEEQHNFNKDSERITIFGGFIRRFKIDELPQVLNVLRGDMSLVGPRPTVIEQVEKYTEKQSHRLDMRPGMTGLAQVNGNVSLTWDERIEYDLEYIKNFSLFLDLKILLKTILVVLFGEEKFKK